MCTSFCTEVLKVQPVVLTLIQLRMCNSNMLQFNWSSHEADDGDRRPENSELHIARIKKQC